MALQFVFGPSGGGKSHYLYSYVIRESMKHPERNYIVLVPEQFTLTTQRELVTMHERHGIMNIDVLSFARLAYRIFEEVGVKELPILDDEGKNLVLRKIAEDDEDKLVMLRGNMKKPGYIMEIKSIISEFTQYDITKDALYEVMEQVGESSRLYYKLQDIYTIYSGFKEYMTNRYLTKEELLDRLCQVVGESTLLINSTIILDGYTGFTPVQNRLIACLLHVTREVKIGATIDKREDPFVYSHPYQLFGLTKQMVSSLVFLCKKEQIKVEDSVYLQEDPPWRFKSNPVFAHLEKNVFRTNQEIYQKNQESIRLLCARNYDEEAKLVAGEIRALIRKEGMTPGKIGVVATDMEMYKDYLIQAFDMFKIPAFIDGKRSILNNPYIEGIRSFISIFSESFSYDSVFRFLKSELSIFKREEVELLENYALASGIKSYRKWQEEWRIRSSDITKEELVELNQLREDFVFFSLPYKKGFRSSQKNVRDISTALYEYMAANNLEQKLIQKADQFLERGELELEKEYRQVYSILINLIDKFVALLGDEVVGMEEYLKLLDAGLLEAKVGVIPPGTNQVITGDLTRTRFDDIDTLFIIGANDNLLPGNISSHGLLSEQDRKSFANLDITLSPTGKEKAYTQKFYLYSHLTKPLKYLYVSFSKSNMNGDALRASYLVTELKQIFPDLTEEDSLEYALSSREFTKELTFEYMIRAFWNEGEELSLEVKELISYYYTHDKERMEQLVEHYFKEKAMPGISKEVAHALYGEDFMNSVTRMEDYSNCSYAHFLSYGLSLKEREIYEFAAMDLGNICHMALEEYSKILNNNEEDWTQISKENTKRYIDRSIEAAVSNYKKDLLQESAKNAYQIEKIRQLVDCSVWALTKQLAAGDFKPTYFEFGFIDGKIDRIDLCKEEDRVYVKVIDYKTGKKELKLGSLYHGLSLQLMIYLDAACNVVKERNHGKKVIPAGALYFWVENPVIEKRLVGEDIGREKLETLRPSGVVSGEVDTVRHLDREMSDKSLVIPVAKNKDGSYSKSSHTYLEEELNTMTGFARHKIASNKEHILKGEANANPFDCTFCPYIDVCGFDESIKGYEKKAMLEADKETFLALMREELDNGC